jgi:uncharacterized OB-fold protein
MNRAAALGPHLPIIDAESEPFWAATKQRLFLIRHCTTCGRNHFYPRHYCPYCWSEACEWRPASGKGRIYSYTVIHHNDMPPFKDMLPYIVALIDLDEGVRVTANLIECTPDVVHVGLPVEVIYEHLNDDIALPQFRPGNQP